MSWESGLIVFHRFASRNTARRGGPAERAFAVLPLEYKCVYDPHDSHPEIQTYLLRTAASHIIMRHEFNLSGPIVNTGRLDSQRVRYNRSTIEEKYQVRTGRYCTSDHESF